MWMPRSPALLRHEVMVREEASVIELIVLFGFFGLLIGGTIVASIVGRLPTEEQLQQQDDTRSSASNSSVVRRGGCDENTSHHGRGRLRGGARGL